MSVHEPDMANSPLSNRKNHCLSQIYSQFPIFKQRQSVSNSPASMDRRHSQNLACKLPSPFPPTIFTIISVSLLFLPLQLSLAQQTYPSQLLTSDCKVHHSENAAYLCTADTPTCETATYFRVQSSGVASTLSSIARLLFGTNTSAITTASGLSSNSVTPGQGLFIPLNCTCSGNYTGYNVTYTIVPDDTFYKLSNNTYEGLTTCQIIQDANPTAIVTDLQIGQKVTIPVKCACPSASQVADGVRWLYSYPVADGDNITSIISRFNLEERLFLQANTLNSTGTSLFAATSVLLPFVNRPSVAPNASTTAPGASLADSSAPSGGSGTSHTGTYVGIGVAAGACVIILAIAAVLCWRRTNKRKQMKEEIPISVPSPAKPVNLTNQKLQQDLYADLSSFANSEKLSSYSLDDLKEATQNFSPATHIKGTVYRGVIKGHVVAVKNMTRNVSKELQILQKVHHANLVTLLGFCIASPEQSYLVYEYAENGSLSDWLHENDDHSMGGDSGSSSSLTWNNRLQVALDIATALEYIHDHTNPSFVHKDIKSSNILLDSKFHGKLANFGLAKSTQDRDKDERGREQQTRHIVGTQGYMAPEYLTQGMVSPKVDVFAFGVVLLELLSGEEAIMAGVVGKERFVCEAIGPLLAGPDAKEKLKGWMDPRLQNAYPLDCAFSVAMLARSCVSENPSSRPNSREMAYTLAKLLEISLEWEPSSAVEQYTDNPLQAR